MPSLRYVFDVDASVDAVWRLHQSADVLARITPPELSVTLPDPPPVLGPGVRFVLKVRPPFSPFAFPWETVVETFEPPGRFVDVQGRGPFAAWRHEHRFEPLGPDRTRITETIDYKAPFGPLGRIADALFLRRMLERAFAFREPAIRAALSATPARSAV